MKVYSSESLEQRIVEADLINGSRVADVISAARILEPLLEDVTVFPLEKSDGNADNDSKVPTVRYFSGGSALVTYPTRRKPYDIFINGLVAGRFKEHRAFHIDAGRSVDVPKVMEITVAHELGHAGDFLRMFKGVPRPIDIDQFFTDDLSTLPLGMATSDALEFWRTNKDGYRRKLKKNGISKRDFKLKILENIEAYGQLPKEKSADDFALRVINNMYS